MKLQWQNMTAFARRVLWNLGACSVEELHREEYAHFQTRERLYQAHLHIDEVEKAWAEATRPFFSILAPHGTEVRITEDLLACETRVTLIERQLAFITLVPGMGWLLKDENHMGRLLRHHLEVHYRGLIEARIHETIKQIKKSKETA